MSAYSSLKGILAENRQPVYNVRVRINFSDSGILLNRGGKVMNESGKEFAVVISNPGSAVVLARVSSQSQAEASRAVVEALKGEVYQDTEICLVTETEVVYAELA